MKVSKKIADIITSSIIGAWEGEAKVFYMAEPDEPITIMFFKTPCSLLIIVHEEMPGGYKNFSLFEGYNQPACNEAIIELNTNFDIYFSGFERYPEWVKLNKFVSELITDIALKQTDKWGSHM